MSKLRQISLAAVAAALSDGRPAPRLVTAAQVASMKPGSVIVDLAARNGGNVEGIARLLFGEYLLAFEIVAGLLITAALGALVLAHRERWMPAKSQAELARERIAGDGYKSSLPAPGTYARHNAVDTPARLPDGSDEPSSVSEILRSGR